MTKPLLMLAAHGAGDDSPANQALCDVGKSVAEALPEFEVVTAFNLGTPGYAEVLRAHASQSITVVPVMISDGYFRNIVLPRAIAQAELSETQVAKITSPIGHHPRIDALLAEQVRTATDLLGTPDVPVIVVGHGTERNPESARSTYHVCDALRERAVATMIVPAFLDQAPLLESVAAQYLTTDIIVAPFLLGGGDHTLKDIPERINVTLPDGEELPACLPRGSYQAVIAAPVGEHPGLAELIIDTALYETNADSQPTTR